MRVSFGVYVPQNPRIAIFPRSPPPLFFFIALTDGRFSAPAGDSRKLSHYSAGTIVGDSLFPLLVIVSSFAGGKKRTKEKIVRLSRQMKRVRDCAAILAVEKKRAFSGVPSGCETVVKKERVYMKNPEFHELAGVLTYYTLRNGLPILCIIIIERIVWKGVYFFSVCYIVSKCCTRRAIYRQ